MNRLILAITMSLLSAIGSGNLQTAQDAFVGGEALGITSTSDSDAHRLYVPHSIALGDRHRDRKSRCRLAGNTGRSWRAAGLAASLAFTSNGRDNPVSVFDTESNKKIADVKCRQRTGLDRVRSVSDRVIACNHRGGTVTFIEADPAKKFERTRCLSRARARRVLWPDGKGHAYMNVEDKDEIVQLDTNEMKVLNHWELTGGQGPTGLAIDRSAGRFSPDVVKGGTAGRRFGGQRHDVGHCQSVGVRRRGV